MANTRPMADPTVRSRWTPRDEADLAERLERKTRIMSEALAPVRDLARDLLRDAGVPSDSVDAPDVEERAVRWLAANAEALRDALAPFDSMVRPG